MATLALLPANNIHTFVDQSLDPFYIHDGAYGFWKGMKYTPNGFYVCGVSVRHDADEENQLINDNVGIDGIKIKACNSANWNE